MAAKLKLLYFAALADQLHCSQEEVELAAGVTTVAELQTWLSGRGDRWQALTGEQVRCAVNHAIAKANHPVAPGDEVAFFPPVTGG